MSMTLTGTVEDQPFCEKGTGFAAVEDIPTDDTDCFWASATLYGNAPVENAERGVQGDGYLVHDRADALYRLLVLEHSIDDDHVGTVTFDFVAVD